MWRYGYATVSPPVTVPITITGSSSLFPLMVSGGVLQTAGGTPYLILGDAPQGANNLPLCKAGNTYAACTGTGDTLSGAQTDSGQRSFLAYIKDRQAQGFNSVWINILCEAYTACGSNGSTQEGTYPFTTQLSAGVHSPDTCPEGGSTAATPGSANCWDMSTVGNTSTGVGITVNGRNTELYWQNIDGYIKLANDLGLQVLANPIPTDNCNSQSQGGSFGFMFLNNNTKNAAKITGYADFLANRYSKISSPSYASNLIWFLFNDYTCWNPTSPFGNYIPGADTVFYNFVSRLAADEAQTGYTKHLMTTETYGNSNWLSDTVNTWSTCITLNGVYYNVGPDYDGGLLSHVQGTAPAILVEGNYAGEDLSGVDAGNQLGGTWIAGCGSADILARSPGATQGNSATCPFRERIQFWKLLFTGAAGYVNGNTYTWQLAAAPNWWSTGRSGVCTGTSPAACLDIASNVQLANAAAFLKAHSWYKIVPDFKRGVNGSGFGIANAIGSPFLTAATGCYPNNGSVSHNCASYYKGSNYNDAINIPKGDLFNAFVVSGAASDNSFAMAYVPGANPACTYPSGASNCGQLASQQITVNNAKVSGGSSSLTAAWYDPTGAMTSPTTTICSPSTTLCTNGSQTYTTPSSLHADGTGDWVLLVTSGTS